MTAPRQWAHAWRGDLPAEALSTRGREELVYELHARAWTDSEIAAHTRMSTYTTARIRDRLGLTPNEEGGLDIATD